MDTQSDKSGINKRNLHLEKEWRPWDEDAEVDMSGYESLSEM
jgi:hypothetical protein